MINTNLFDGSIYYEIVDFSVTLINIINIDRSVSLATKSASQTAKRFTPAHKSFVLKSSQS